MLLLLLDGDMIDGRCLGFLLYCYIKFTFSFSLLLHFYIHGQYSLYRSLEYHDVCVLLYIYFKAVHNPRVLVVSF